MTPAATRTEEIGTGAAFRREHFSPAHAANARRNARAMWWRAARWRAARAALWRLLDRHVTPGALVAVVGAGNAHDLPLRRLRRRAGRLDLIDLDAAALRRAQRRLMTGRRMVRTRVEDVTFGRADAISRAAIDGLAPPEPDPTPPAPSGTYDVLLADLLFTQLLYPALADADLHGPAIDATLERHGQPLTDAVVAWLHASAPHGLVIHVHDVLGWWPGHRQPFGIEEVLGLAGHDPESALAMVAEGNVPIGCDPRPACQAIGAEILETAFWRWPFAPGVDYLVCATVARSPEQPAAATTRDRRPRPIGRPQPRPVHPTAARYFRPGSR